MSISFFKVTSPEKKKNVLRGTQQFFPHNPFIFPSTLDAHTVQWASWKIILFVALVTEGKRHNITNNDLMMGMK